MTSSSFTGFELDRTSYEKAKPRVEQFGGTVYCAPLGSVRTAPADLFCAFEVLEHIEEDGAALKEWHDYIVDGGHLLLSVPADPRRFGPMDVYAGHYRRYTESALSELLADAGFEDVQARRYGWPLGYALEAVRNRIDARRLRSVTDLEPAALTAASGRVFQFHERSWKSEVATVATTPFRYLQGASSRGTGLVVTARKRR